VVVTGEKKKKEKNFFWKFLKMIFTVKIIAFFSPKGRLFTLPRGAVALDFAYAVHTGVGR